MTGSTTDKDTLFGMLAVRVGFLTDGALAAGLDARGRSGARPLAEVLVEQGTLSEHRRGLLEVLVDECLLRPEETTHEGPESTGPAAPTADGSATAGDSEAPETQELARSGGTEPTVDHAPGGIGRNGSGRPAGSGVRFRPLKLHRRGGLGEVYLARDEELGRVVALKEIQARHLRNDWLRSRFVLEAEINGNLEHPGIVPVYGLGAYDDGRPFYAMRFVAGGSLAEAIARYHEQGRPGHDAASRRLGLRQLLGRFIDVCDAIAYAHSRGVLHRDLKPANVMLGRYGETLVVDWGLAKATGSGEQAGPDSEASVIPASGESREPTLAGQALGTVGYMSPEQAMGRLGSLGPATDVYSLGAVLYCILAGRSPLRGPATPDVLARLTRGEFERPRAIDPAIPKGLEAIALKALETRPEDRYETVSALAADVERWLADEPVSVIKEPWSTRAWRWGRRHRTLVTGAAAALAAVTAGLAIGLYGVNAERARTEEQWKRAEDGWARARANGSTVRGLAMNTLGLAEDRLSAIPGTEPIRKEMVGQSLKGYRTLLARDPTDRDLRFDSARLHVYSGSIHRLMNQETESDADYRQAITLLDGLLAELPGDRLTRDQLSVVLRDRASLLRRWGKLGEAERVLGRSLDLARALQAESVGDPMSLKAEGVARINLGEVELQLGRTAEALGNATRAEEIFRRLVKTRRGDSKVDPLLLAMALGNKGVAHRERGEIAEALRALDEKVASTRELRENTDKGRDPTFLLASGIEQRSETMLARPGPRDGLEEGLAEALRLWDELVRGSPHIPHYREHQATTLLLRARARVEAGNPAESGDDLESASTTLEVLIKQAPGLPQYKADLAGVRLSQGDRVLAAKDEKAAKERYADAVRLLDEAARGSPDDAAIRKSRAEAEARRRRASGG